MGLRRGLEGFGFRLLEDLGFRDLQLRAWNGFADLGGCPAGPKIRYPYFRKLPFQGFEFRVDDFPEPEALICRSHVAIKESLHGSFRK